MAYFGLLIVLLLSFGLNAMEQLSPRKKEIAQAINSFVNMSVEDQTPILQALRGSASENPLIKNFLDNQQNRSIDGYAHFTLAKIDKQPCDDIISVGQNFTIERGAQRIIKRALSDGAVEIIHTASGLENADFISETLFAYQLQEKTGQYFVMLRHDGQEIAIDQIKYISNTELPMCFNASGTVLAYPKLYNAFDPDILRFYSVISGKYTDFPVKYLKADGAGKNKTTLYSSLARNPQNFAQMVCLTACGNLMVFDVTDVPVLKKEIKAFTKMEERAVAFSHDGRYLAATTDKVLKIWDCASDFESCEIVELDQAIYKIAFSPKGNWLALATKDAIKFYSLKDKKVVTTLKYDTAYGCWFTPDGRTFIIKSCLLEKQIWSINPTQS